MKQDQMSFKRPKGQERKRIVPDTNVASYQPFSSTQNTDNFASPATTDGTERDTNRTHNCNFHFFFLLLCFILFFVLFNQFSIFKCLSISAICIRT